MYVIGCDYSSHHVDVVRVLYDTTTTAQPLWLRFNLTGNDAFDRARSVADSLPGRHSTFHDDVLAWGIEDPRGQNAGALYRVQGAILAHIPARMLVEKWVPSAWRKANGLPGNCPKRVVFDHARHVFDQNVPQDACDAYCVAIATRNAIEAAT